MLQAGLSNCCKNMPLLQNNRTVCSTNSCVWVPYILKFCSAKFEVLTAVLLSIPHLQNITQCWMVKRKCRQWTNRPWRWRKDDLSISGTCWPVDTTQHPEYLILRLSSFFRKEFINKSHELPLIKCFPLRRETNNVHVRKYKICIVFLRNQFCSQQYISWK
jgi:hypothetical protein